MANANQISASISAADMQAIKDAINTIKTKLEPVLLFNLSEDDRKGIAKMGDKTLPFVGKAFGYADQNPELVPAYMNLAEGKKDLALSQDLYEVLQQLQPLLTAVEDTYTIAGAEAYDAARTFYGFVLGASNNNVAGTQAIYDDLRKRFPGRPRKQLDKTENKPA